MDMITLERGTTRLRMMDPLAEEPYYRGTRFDRTGIILELESGGHRYIQPWQRHYDPWSHDAVSGPAEEFLPVSPGAVETAGWLKIGVGLLRDDGAPYDRFKLYDILDPGLLTVSAGLEPTVVTFRHKLSDRYDYVKTVEIPAEGRLHLTHALRNDSPDPIDTYVYCHNFFILDGAPTGRATRFEFPWRPVGDWRAPYDSVRLTDRGIAFDRDLRPDETVFMGNLRPDSPKNQAPVSLLLQNNAGVQAKKAQNAVTPSTQSMSNDSPAASGYRFALRNLDNGLGVEASCDSQMEYAVFWSNSDVSCLEPYIPIHLNPGQTARWTLDYRFL